MHTVVNKNDQRRRMIAAIHVAKHQARMCPVHQRLQFEERCIICGEPAPELTDDQYRDVLRRATGKRSSSDMSSTELKAILTIFQNAGFKPRRRERMSEMIAKSRNGMAKGIEQLAQEVLGDAWERRLSGYIRKRFDKDSVRFLGIKELQSVYGFLRGVQREMERKQEEEQARDDHGPTGHAGQNSENIIAFPGTGAGAGKDDNHEDHEEG